MFVDKKSRITAGGLVCANSTHVINHVDSTLNWQILEWLSKGQDRCRCLGRRVLTPSPGREFHPRDQSWVAQEKPPNCTQNLRYTQLERSSATSHVRQIKRTSRARTEFTVIAIWLKKNWHISYAEESENVSAHLKARQWVIEILHHSKEWTILNSKSGTSLTEMMHINELFPFSGMKRASQDWRDCKTHVSESQNDSDAHASNTSAGKQCSTRL